MRNAGLEKAQTGIKIAGENINSLRYADDTTLMAESEEELKSLLRKVKEESEKNFTANRFGNWKQWLTLFFWPPKSLQMVISTMKLKDAYSL